MKKAYLLIILFSIVTIIIQAQNSEHLSVDGDARIIGKLDLREIGDATSLSIGHKAGINSPTPSGRNVLIGNSAGQHAEINFFDNTFVGYKAGNLITDRVRNTFVGSRAGYLATDGIDNTFIGYASGSKNGSGKYNTFLGSMAGSSNVEGQSNTFVGYSAGLSNVSGDQNVLIGYQAGRNCVDCYQNTYIGFLAGRNDTSGRQNVAVGRGSGNRITNGEYNTLLGTDAGFGITSGKNNTCLGHEAGEVLKTSKDNTLVGRRSAPFLNSGDYNTVLGSIGLSKAKKATGNIGIGHFIFAQLDSSDYNLAIGHKAAFFIRTGQDNIILGRRAGNGIFDGDNNIIMGYNAGSLIGTGNNNIIIGTNSGKKDTPIPMGLYNAVAIGNNIELDCDDCMMLGGIGNNALDIGIGIDDPQFQLQLSTESAAKPGSGSWIIASDARLKSNVKDYTDGLEAILKIKPVWYNYKNKYNLPHETPFVGVIAQDLQRVAPYMISETSYKDEKGEQQAYLHVDPHALPFMTVNAIHEQQVIINDLKNEIAAIKEAYKELHDAFKKQLNQASN